MKLCLAVASGPQAWLASAATEASPDIFASAVHSHHGRSKRMLGAAIGLAVSALGSLFGGQLFGHEEAGKVCRAVQQLGNHGRDLETKVNCRPLAMCVAGARGTGYRCCTWRTSTTPSSTSNWSPPQGSTGPSRWGNGCPRSTRRRPLPSPRTSR